MCWLFCDANIAPLFPAIFLTHNNDLAHRVIAIRQERSLAGVLFHRLTCLVAVLFWLSKPLGLKFNDTSHILLSLTLSKHDHGLFAGRAGQNRADTAPQRLTESRQMGVSHFLGDRVRPDATDTLTWALFGPLAVRGSVTREI